MPCGIGKGLATKVNANFGTSSDFGSVENRAGKLRVCEEAKADTVMDLSTGGDIAGVRRAVLAATSLPLGTVPVYQAGIQAQASCGAMIKMTPDDLFGAIEDHAATELISLPSTAG